MPALSMIAMLLAGSGFLCWGERAVARGHEATARLSIVLTIALGLAFLTMQISQYREHLRAAVPAVHKYGSIFDVITGVYDAQVLLALLLLSYVLCLPRIGGDDRAARDPMRNIARYWHVVDAAWIVIVAILYLRPGIS